MTGQCKGRHLDQLTHAGKEKKREQGHLCDSRSDAGDVEKGIGDRRQYENRPPAIFVYPWLDAVVDVHAFDDRLSAEACQISGEFADSAPGAGSQPDTQRVEDRPHSIDQRYAGGRQQDRRVGKQGHQKDARIPVLCELLNTSPNAVDVERDRNHSQESQEPQKICEKS